MRDQINRNNPIAEEHLKPTGHPAKEKFDEWKTNVSGTIDAFEENKKKDTPEQRKKKIEQMDEIIKEDIERMEE